jgi:hypothetical protein
MIGWLLSHTWSTLEPNLNRTLTELFRFKYGLGTAKVMGSYELGVMSYELGLGVMSWEL